jgi:hypothetical protein
MAGSFRLDVNWVLGVITARVLMVRWVPRRSEGDLVVSCGRKERMRVVGLKWVLKEESVGIWILGDN